MQNGLVSQSPDQSGPDPKTPGIPAMSRRPTRRPIAAYVVLAIGVVLSLALAGWTARLVERESRQKFENYAADARAAIDARIRAYSNLLLGVRGLFVAHPANRTEFRRFITSFDLTRRYPGAQVIHFSRRISAAEKQAFEVPKPSVCFVGVNAVVSCCRLWAIACNASIPFMICSYETST